VILIYDITTYMATIPASARAQRPMYLKVSPLPHLWAERAMMPDDTASTKAAMDMAKMIWFKRTSGLNAQKALKMSEPPKARRDLNPGVYTPFLIESARSLVFYVAEISLPRRSIPMREAFPYPALAVPAARQSAVRRARLRIRPNPFSMARRPMAVRIDSPRLIEATARNLRMGGMPSARLKTSGTVSTQA